MNVMRRINSEMATNSSTRRNDGCFLRRDFGWGCAAFTFALASTFFTRFFTAFFWRFKGVFYCHFLDVGHRENLVDCGEAGANGSYSVVGQQCHTGGRGCL